MQENSEQEKPAEYRIPLPAKTARGTVIAVKQFRTKIEHLANV